MPHVYERVAEGGASMSSREVPLRPMLVRLYPGTPDEVAACSEDGIATEALVTAGEQLHEYGSIDYYAVYRYRTEDPRLGDPGNFVDFEDASGSFKRFLRSWSGADEDLYAYRGVHQLIHGESTGCDEDADGYAPNGAGAEYSQPTAFGAGVVAWSPLCPDDEGLTKNATIQETVHCLLHYEGYPDSFMGSENDEHTLGWVRDKRTSPMLTYHWDDDLGEFGGECPSTAERPIDHSQRLTPCALEAVARTAAKKADRRLG